MSPNPNQLDLLSQQTIIYNQGFLQSTLDPITHVLSMSSSSSTRGNPHKAKIHLLNHFRMGWSLLATKEVILFVEKLNLERSSVSNNLSLYTEIQIGNQKYTSKRSLKSNGPHCKTELGTVISTVTTQPRHHKIVCIEQTMNAGFCWLRREGKMTSDIRSSQEENNRTPKERTGYFQHRKSFTNLLVLLNGTSLYAV